MGWVTAHRGCLEDQTVDQANSSHCANLCCLRPILIGTPDSSGGTILSTAPFCYHDTLGHRIIITMFHAFHISGLQPPCMASSPLDNRPSRWVRGPIVVVSAANPPSDKKRTGGSDPPRTILSCWRTIGWDGLFSFDIQQSASMSSHHHLSN